MVVFFFEGGGGGGGGPWGRGREDGALLNKISLQVTRSTKPVIKVLHELSQQVPGIVPSIILPVSKRFHNQVSHADQTV